MFSDARMLPEDSRISTDICIVGAGPVGITLACELGPSGRNITLIESGGIKAEREVQTLSEGICSPGAHPNPDLYRQRKFGGTTGIWGGRCVPFDEIDFEPRGYMPHSGWPFNRAQLEPFYRKAMQYCEAGEFLFDAGAALPGPPHIVENFSGQDIDDNTIERFSMPTDFGRRYRATLAAFPNIRVITHAACIRLAQQPGQARIAAADCRGLGGGSFQVLARVFVVANGGLETVRLLSSCLPLLDGARNLGRYYMCHVEGTLGILRLSPASRPVHWSFERTRDGIYARRRFSVRPEAQRRHGSLNLIARLHYPHVADPGHRHSVLSAMFLTKRFLIPEFRRKFSNLDRVLLNQRMRAGSMLAAHARNVAAGLPGLARFGGEWVWTRYLRERRMPAVALRSRIGEYPLDFNAEQSPNVDSRVLLAPQLDRFGQPKLQIDWRMSELDIRSIAVNFRLMRTDFARSGVGELWFDDGALESEIANCTPVGGHHIGTARMAPTAATGVVDANGRAFGVANLFVSGSSVFPTSSHANPTLTAVALAIRLAALIGREEHR